MNALPRQVGRLALVAALVVLSMLVVLTALGWMPTNRTAHSVDPRDDPLVAPDKLGGYSRWYGMAKGELRDAEQLGRKYRAAAIEAAYLLPGMDPLLASAVRAQSREPLLDSVAIGRHGRVRCTTAGLFVECVRTSPQLTVHVLANKKMDPAEAASLVEEFWSAQQLSRPAPTTPGSTAPSPG